MINSRLSGAEQSRAIGTWTAWTGTAFVIGPLLGGVLVDALNWRWIFGVNIVPLAVTLYLTTKLSRDEFAAERPAQIDVTGAVLNAVGLTGTVYALIEQQRLGFSHPAVVASLAVGIACLLAFPWWERRSPHPMMPLHIFAARNFAVGNLATVFVYAAVSLGTLIVTLFLQETAGLSASQAGLATLPIPVLSFFLARRFGTLAGLHGPRRYMAVGPLVAAVGYLLMMTARDPFNFWTQMLPGLVVFGLGLSITVSPLTAAILAAVEPAQSGIGSAINNAVSRIAGLIAVAFTGVIISLGERSDGIASGAIDFAGFRQGALVVAGLFGVAGIISAIGIRDEQYDYQRVSSETVAGCRDRATPPPSYAGRAGSAAVQQQLPQLVLDLGGRDEQQLVAALQRLVGLRHDHPRTAQDSDQRRVARQRELAHRPTAPGRVVGQGDLHQVGVALAELHQPDQVTDRDRLLHHRGQHPGCGHRDIDAPGLVEQPLVARIVDPGHHPGHRELRLGQQADHHVDLVVTGRGDHHVELLEVHRLQHAQLAGVAEAPVRGRDGIDIDVVGIAFEQRHLVFVLEQFAGNGTADGAGSGNGDFHGASMSSLGGSAAMASASAIRPDTAAI